MSISTSWPSSIQKPYLPRPSPLRLRFRRFCHLTGFFLRSLLYRNGCLAFSFCDHFSGLETPTSSYYCCPETIPAPPFTVSFLLCPFTSTIFVLLIDKRTYLRSGVPFSSLSSSWLSWKISASANIRQWAKTLLARCRPRANALESVVLSACHLFVVLVLLPGRHIDHCATFSYHAGTVTDWQNHHKIQV